MDESTLRTLTFAVHMLSIVIVACTVAIGGALVGMSRAVERWTLTLTYFRPAEDADQKPAVMRARGKHDDG